MKFGVFLPNGSNEYIISKAIPPYLPTWELNQAVTIEAERQGLDFVLSMQDTGLLDVISLRHRRKE